jgi:MFS family permease
LDEGLIASTVAEDSFIQDFNLHATYLSAAEKANRLSNVTSMVHIGSLPGAVVGFLLCEWIGMLWTMREMCITWIVGSIIFLTSQSLGQVYAGRFVMGLGIGQAGVIAHIYLAEIAPSKLRGMIVCIFGMSEYIGVFIGVSLFFLLVKAHFLVCLSDYWQYFSIWGACIHISDSSPSQWIIPQSVRIMWAVLLIIASLPCEESPRFLCKNGLPDKACEVFGRLWELHPMDPVIQFEMENARKQLSQEQKASSGRSWISAFKELLMTCETLRRIGFVITLQLLSQWLAQTR